MCRESPARAKVVFYVSEASHDEPIRHKAFVLFVSSQHVWLGTLDIIESLVSRKEPKCLRPFAFQTINTIVGILVCRVTQSQFVEIPAFSILDLAAAISFASVGAAPYLCHGQQRIQHSSSSRIACRA